MRLRLKKVESDRKNSTGFENLGHRRIIAPAGDHYRNSTLMLAAVGIMMKQLMKLGGSSKSDDNQQTRDEQINECALPNLRVPKPRHFE